VVASECLQGPNPSLEKENLQVTIHEIGSRSFTRRREMTSPRKLGPYNSEDDFFEDFNLMKSMVEEMYKGRRRPRRKVHQES
jgi:hypothetical protein